MDEYKQKLIHLTHCEHVGHKSIERMLKVDPSLSYLYSFSSAELQQIFQLPSQKVERIKNDLQTIPIQDILEKYKKQGISCISLNERDYPMLLKNIYDPPWLLYAYGHSKLLHHAKMLGVVGTRQPTEYGYEALQAILEPLVKKNWLVVSGLAIGIDTAAHRLALECGGQTVAVLGSGFYNMYPKQNQELAAHIGKHHLLLSEYPPSQKPRPWQFPFRNRIISGLTRGTVVVEAKTRSGSFITADQALHQGREVFAVPGSILSEHSKGTHSLIQQGAKLITSAEDVEVEFSM